MSRWIGRTGRTRQKPPEPAPPARGQRRRDDAFGLSEPYPAARSLGRGGQASGYVDTNPGGDSSHPASTGRRASSPGTPESHLSTHPRAEAYGYGLTGPGPHAGMERYGEADPERARRREKWRRDHKRRKTLKSAWGVTRVVGFWVLTCMVTYYVVQYIMR